MNLEDYEEDDDRPLHAQRIASQRAAGDRPNPSALRSPQLAPPSGQGAVSASSFRMPAPGRGYGQTLNELEHVGPDSRAGLSTQLHQLSMQSPRLEGPQSFGLTAEVSGPSRPPALRTPSGVLRRGPSPLGPVQGVPSGAHHAQDSGLESSLQPLRQLAPLPDSRNMGFAPAASMLQPARGAFGLDNEVHAAAGNDGARRPSLPEARPADRGPLLPRAQHGLAHEMQEAPFGLAEQIQTAGQYHSGSFMQSVGQDESYARQDYAASPHPLLQPQQTTQQLGPYDQYGLANEVYNETHTPAAVQHSEANGSQLWSQPFADTLRLDQLPEDQRYLHLNARQAERIMLELGQQGIVPKVVDIKDVHEKLLDASAPPRLAYITAVEQAAPDHRLPASCRPSLLQTKLKNGQNKLRKLVEPVVEPGGQSFVDLSFTPEGALLPETTRVWQFGLSLVQADGVGKTGLHHVRQPCLFIARMALFDRRANRFLGNVLGLRPEAVTNYDKRWAFNAEERVIVRCGCVQADPQAGTRLVTDDSLSVFVEFNLSYRLQVEDTLNMPQSEAKCAQLLDEINTCWAMISFKKCTQLQREVQISVPLYYGSVYDPQPMDAFYTEKRSKTPFRSAFKAKENPVLQFRAGPLGQGKPPLVPYNLMPPTMLATHDLGTALAAYRICLALTLARQPGPFTAAADPVLAAFPALLSDHHLVAEFLTRWRDLTNKLTAILDVGCCSPEVMPPLSALVEAFRRCAVELTPLARCPTIPARHINNFIEYQGHRLRLVQRYCHVMDPATNKIMGARHPVEPLSHAGFEFLHMPFDTAEVRLCMADRLERPEPFYRH